MLAKTTQLHSARDTQRYAVALVTEAIDGHGYRVSLEGETLPVVGHLSQVDYLHCGAQVLVTTTRNGAIIIGRLRIQDEKPQQSGADIPEHLHLEARQSICLKTAKGRIEIDGHGKILINGRLIIQLADGPVKLQGATIELN